VTTAPFRSTSRVLPGFFLAVTVAVNGYAGLHRWGQDRGRSHESGQLYVVFGAVALLLGGWGLATWGRAGLLARLAVIGGIVLAVIGFMVVGDVYTAGLACACDGS
jgi:hypothetical protein